MQSLNRLLFAAMRAPVLLVILWLVTATLVVWIAECSPVTAESIPKCTLFGTVEVGPFVYSSIGAGYSFAYTFLWAGACLLLITVLNVIAAFARAFK